MCVCVCVWPGRGEIKNAARTDGKTALLCPLEGASCRPLLPIQQSAWTGSRRVWEFRRRRGVGGRLCVRVHSPLSHHRRAFVDSFFGGVVFFYILFYKMHSDNYIPANPMVTPASIVPE